MKEVIESILTAYGKKIKLGIEIFSLTKNKILFAKDEEEPFVPASCTKLFTTAVSLGLLGHDFVFKTEFLSDAKLGATLEGNLYVRGSGDPSFTRDDLKKMVESLFSFGIRKIKGNIILDGEVFDKIYHAPGVIKHEDDEEALWGAKVSGLSVNYNCEEVWIHPGELNGAPIVHLPLSISPSNFSNHATTSSHPGELKIFKKDQYEMTGEIGLEEKAVRYFIPVDDPIDFFAKELLGFLKEKGIDFRGKILRERTRENLHLLTSHLSQKLPELLPRILKESDNLYADALFKMMGSKKEMLGSWESGKRAAFEFFQKHVRDRYDFFDGSGLSHQNQVTSKQIIQLLRHVYYDKKLCEDFFLSLPIGGIDGTLKDRMKDPNSKRIYAKTGSLKGVSSLAGFVTTKTNETIAFSLLASDIDGFTDEYKKNVEDKIALFLANL